MAKNKIQSNIEQLEKIGDLLAKRDASDRPVHPVINDKVKSVFEESLNMLKQKQDSMSEATDYQKQLLNRLFKTLIDIRQVDDFDSLIEGTPQGVGGVPISRKQVRAQRKALDLIEDEVGRPINYHSYVSGVAGPEIAVMFAEEGVNGAHQDPQYNVLYRNINMIRSFIDAAESKKIMAHAKILQIDGAHNANATAKEAWKVMPELLVQHGINCRFSEAAGMDNELIALSTVPPTASPAPDLKINLPYAVALRDFFNRYKMRAQMNAKYM
jgi:hypothetical protein